MRRSRPVRQLPALLALFAATAAPAQRADDGPATRAAFVDRAGVVRWKDDGTEVALFGANYTLPSASDFRAAGRVSSDRKRMIDEDVAHFARMGWTGMRVALWGDWENTDRAGRLVANEHLDLMDYLLARARERGIYVLLTPIQTYDARWPDALADTTLPGYDGFARFFPKDSLGTSAAAIAAQARYLAELLEHVNPYTRTAIKDEPAILFVEMINEPTHHADDLAGSVRYIDALVDAVRRTGCDKILFHNVSQDFRIADAIARSRVQGSTFGWYPTGLNSGHELRGSSLRTVDAYPALRLPSLAGRPRIVYEFDSADLRTGYMYPAMARAFREGGVQFAAMFAYDMLATASRNLGWQTHYLNLAYTPRKAMSAVIAAEAMRRLPRLRSYGAYPANRRFGDFRVSAEENLGELAARDAFLYTGTTTTRPPNAASLTRVAGVGSSPVVRYDGSGAYFLDRVRAGVWRLEVYPDVDELRDPFEAPSVDKVVTRAVARARAMTVRLPELGPSYILQAVAPAGDSGAASATTSGTTLGTTSGVALGTPTPAAGGRVVVRPGVYLLSARGGVDPRTLPATLRHVRFAEFHPPPLAEATEGDATPAGARAVAEATRAGTSRAPLVLFAPRADSARLAFSRIGDGWREGIYRLGRSPAGAPTFQFAVPVIDGRSPDDYTASLVILDSIAARRPAVGGAHGLVLRLRGLGARQTVHVTLVERDGTSWSALVALDSAWQTRTIPLAELRPARSVKLPQGYPGDWNYWLSAPAGRGGAGDRLRLADVERLQLSLRHTPGTTVAPWAYGVEIEFAELVFQ